MFKKDWVWELYPDRKKKIKKLASKIRPIVRFEGVPYFIKPVHPFNVAFTWEVKRGPEAKHLTAVKDIRTFHSWSYYGFFKPSVAECIARIPEDLLDKVNAFEIVQAPQTAADFHTDEEVSQAFNASFHTATTRLYVGAIPVDWRDKVQRFLDEKF